MKILTKIIIIIFQISLYFSLSTSNDCFEYSCELCTNSEYGSCTKCKENFKLIDGTCPCNDYACNICDTSFLGSKCYYCDENYKINALNQCVCEDSNCEICDKNGCLKCKSGFINHNTLCIPIENYQSNCLDENCIQCTNTIEKYTCTQCNKGYELVMGKCIKLKNIQNFSCSDSNYYPSFDGLCYPKCGGADCENNNIFYNECTNNCLICIKNDLYYYPDCNDESSTIDNCSVQKNNYECSICNVGYYKKRGQCEKCQKGCKKCSDKNTCLYCDHNYNLLDDGTCEEITKNSEENIQEKFNEFKIEYIMQKENYILKINENQDNNFIINEKCEIDHCISCSKLINNFCLLCENNYENFNGQCYKKDCQINNCAECDDENICSKCNNGYFLENNQCKLSCDIKNCESCESPYYCDKCKDGYEFNGYECKLKCSISNCLECGYNKCYQCNNGYYLNSYGYCNKCKINNCKNCNNYNNRETCYECDDGFQLNNNKCSNICDIENCEYCLRDENVCAKCEKNCVLKGDKCSCKNIIPLIVGLVITFSIVFSAGIIISIYIYKKRKRARENESNQRNNAVRVEIINNNNINNNDRNNNNSTNDLENINYPYLDNERNSINNNDVEKRIPYNNLNGNNNLCVYCHRKVGTERRNCGCLLCEEHKKPKEIIKNGDRILQCIKCGEMIVNKGKVNEGCEICLEVNRILKHFRCGCNGKVCNNCYQRILRERETCPFCRKSIR